MPEPADELDRWIAAVTPRAFAYAQTLVGRGDAEDLVHDCFSRLLAHREYDLVRDGTQLLFKAITHAAINRKSRQKPTVGIEGASSAEGPAIATTAKNKTDDRRAAQLCRPKHRSICG